MRTTSVLYVIKLSAHALKMLILTKRLIYSITRCHLIFQVGSPQTETVLMFSYLDPNQNMELSLSFEPVESEHVEVPEASPKQAMTSLECVENESQNKLPTNDHTVIDNSHSSNENIRERSSSTISNEEQAKTLSKSKGKMDSNLFLVRRACFRGFSEYYKNLFANVNYSWQRKRCNKKKKTYKHI